MTSQPRTILLFLGALALQPAVVAHAAPHTPDAAAIARAYLRDHGSKLGIDDTDTAAVRSVHPVGDRQVVRLDQLYRGVPVLRASMKVAVDAAGSVVRVANGFHPLRDGGDWKISREEAVDIVATKRPTMGPEAVHDPQARRIVVPVSGVAIPAWQVYLPTPLLPEKYYYYVDARDGSLLFRENRVVSMAQANAFLFNPGADGDLDSYEQVTLDHLLPTEQRDPAGALDGELVEAYNCMPTAEDGFPRTVEVDYGGNTVDITICDERQVAVADEEGDYLFTPSHTERGDLFAEAHAYFHVNQVYDYFRSLGGSDFRVSDAPLRVTVNYLSPGSPWNGNRLSNFDNAFFMAADMPGMLPGDWGRSYDSIVLGQGSGGDFAYDADVIYHEFTHAVVNRLVGDTQYVHDDQGLSTAPLALNEGFADYFSMTITGDSHLSEYMGPRLGDEGPMRDGTNDYRCPEVIIGESHHDSMHWSGALWELRQAVVDSGLDPALLNQAVFDALAELVTPDAYFDDAARSVIITTREQLGEEWAQRATQIFEERGLIGCERVEGMDQVPEYFIMQGTATYPLAPFVPGPMQFRVTVPSGTNSLTVSFDFSPTSYGAQDSAADIGFLVKAGAPVSYTYNGSRVIDDADDLYSTRGTNLGRAAIPIEDPCQETTLYLAPVNQGQGQALIQNLTATPHPAANWDPAVDCPDDEAPDEVTQPGSGGDADDGCSCNGAGAGGSLLPALFLLAPVLLRRRSH